MSSLAAGKLMDPQKGQQQQQQQQQHQTCPWRQSNRTEHTCRRSCRDEASQQCLQVALLGRLWGYGDLGPGRPCRLETAGGRPWHVRHCS